MESGTRSSAAWRCMTRGRSCSRRSRTQQRGEALHAAQQELQQAQQEAQAAQQGTQRCTSCCAARASPALPAAAPAERHAAPRCAAARPAAPPVPAAARHAAPRRCCSRSRPCVRTPTPLSEEEGCKGLRSPRPLTEAVFRLRSSLSERSDRTQRGIGIELVPGRLPALAVHRGRHLSRPT